MHLVFATSLIPDKSPTTGYEIANAAILDALHRCGVRVTIVGYSRSGKSPADPDNTIDLGPLEVENQNASTTTKLRWVVTALARGLTVSSAKLLAVPDHSLRAALAKIEPFDAVMLNAVPFAGAFENIFKSFPTLYVAHNVEYRSAREIAEHTSSGLLRILYRREAKILENLEKRLCSRASFVFTLSEEDRKLLAPEDKSAVLPLTTGSLPKRNLNTGAARTCDAALIGTWSWQPNRIGLEWFANQVVPLLDPDFHVQIAGSIPSDFFMDHRNVKLVGRVPDAAGFLHSAAVVALVSKAGTGVQLKTIETFELGLPAVATQHSVRGIARIPDNCSIADDPHEFANHLQTTARQVREGRNPTPDPQEFADFQREQMDRSLKAGLMFLDQSRQV